MKFDTIPLNCYLNLVLLAPKDGKGLSLLCLGSPQSTGMLNHNVFSTVSGCNLMSNKEQVVDEWNWSFWWKPTAEVCESQFVFSAPQFKTNWAFKQIKNVRQRNKNTTIMKQEALFFFKLTFKPRFFYNNHINFRHMRTHIHFFIHFV